MSRQDTTSPRRHCMVVHAYYPLGETRVEREAQALVTHGYEVDVLCLRYPGEPEFEVQSGIKIYRLPVRRRKRGAATKQLLEYLAFFFLASVKLATLHRRQKYGVVQVHNLPDFLIFAALIPKLAGARLVLDLHDLMPEFYAARFGKNMDSRTIQVVRWQELLACRFADHVITVTEPWRQTLIRRGLPPEKVSVVMNVADDRLFFREAKTSVKSDKDGRLDLIYHGSLTPRYGLELAIRAVGIARAKIPHPHLTIHSGASPRRAMVELAEELDLQQHITYSSKWMPTEKLPAFLLQADVGIVPYNRDVFTDGILPTKLMEYVALGLPVIAARTPTIDAYFDETMVEFFTPGDASDLARCIEALYFDPQHMAALVENSDGFNQRYNWTRLGSEYVTLVDQIGSGSTLDPSTFSDPDGGLPEEHPRG